MGRAAAAFALNRKAEDGAEAGKILFLRDDLVSPEDWEAFKQGLKAEEYLSAPFDVRNGADYAVPGDIACAVLTGAAEPFFSQDLSLPVILFSWVDPALTNSMVKVVFDDSPWAQAAAAAEAAAGKRGNEGIPSKVLVLKKRIPEKEFLRKIEGIARESGTDL
jgi:hypothetical protein